MSRSSGLWLRHDLGDDWTKRVARTEELREGRGGFIEELDEAELRGLEDMGRRRRFSKGSTLFFQDDEPESVMLITAGSVKVTHISSGGKEAVLAILGPGELVGELSAIDCLPRSATVVALDDVDALVIPARGFDRYLMENPRVCFMLLKMVSSRLRDTGSRWVDIATHDTVGRLARLLIDLADRFGVAVDGGTEIDMSLSQQELAGMVASSREGVNKALATLRGRGWVKTRRQKILVVDDAALRRRGQVEAPEK